MVITLRNAVLPAAVVCLVWVAVVWHWEAHAREVTAADVGLQLGLLPIVVSGALAGVLRLWRSGAPRRTPAAPPPAGAGTASAATVDATTASVRPSTWLLSAHVHGAAGHDAAEMLASLAEHRTSPALDPEFRDEDGLAVLTARLDALVPEAIEGELEPVFAALRPLQASHVAFTADERVLRALAALADPLDEALAEAAKHLDARAAGDDRTLRPPSRTASTGPLPAPLTVLLGWPSDWDEIERVAATEWVRRRLSSRGDASIDGFLLVPHATERGETLWREAERLLEGESRGDPHALLLVAGCHSSLGASAVAELGRTQRLYSPLRRPQGLMPGEAAAALLLAPAGRPLAADGPTSAPPIRLHPAAFERRVSSCEAPGSPSSEQLQSCIDRVLAATATDPASVAGLASDGDGHGPRGVESYEVAIARLPRLRADADIRLLSTGCGYTGPVGTLLAIALAAEQARAAQAPCVALSVGDPWWRLAVLAVPAAPKTSFVP